jgi:hypothetical protein
MKSVLDDQKLSGGERTAITRDNSDGAEIGQGYNANIAPDNRTAKDALSIKDLSAQSIYWKRARQFRH